MNNRSKESDFFQMRRHSYFKEIWSLKRIVYLEFRLFTWKTKWNAMEILIGEKWKNISNKKTSVL